VAAYEQWSRRSYRQSLSRWAGFGFRGELALTGRGDDIIIIDDPLKPEEALSQAQPQAANEWYDYTGICYHPKN
jgi:hypothetical protein